MLIFSLSRLISAWFYKGHSPNIDFFHVRPEFANIRKGLAPKKTFEEYLEMPEYNNIMTRMFGKLQSLIFLILNINFSFF